MIIKPTPWNNIVLGGETVELYSNLQELDAFAEQLDETLIKLRQLGVIFAQIRTDGCLKKRKILERRGFRFIDISYELKFNNPLGRNVTWKMPTGVELCSSYSETELHFARQLAVDDFEFGRLLEDPTINRSSAQARTGRWLDQLSCQPCNFYIAKCKGKPIGFHAERRDGEHVEWILTGVAKQYSMLAPMLWQEVFLLARTNGFKSIKTIISALNSGVVNIYNIFPFRVNRVLCGYHWHNCE